jgi:hypothetical protein
MHGAAARPEVPVIMISDLEGLRVPTRERVDRWQLWGYLKPDSIAYILNINSLWSIFGIYPRNQFYRLDRKAAFAKQLLCFCRQRQDARIAFAISLAVMSGVLSDAVRAIDWCIFAIGTAALGALFLVHRIDVFAGPC